MKKILTIAVAVSTLGLAGCVAVPYGDPYGYGYGYVAPAPAVVVRPGYYGRYSYYGHRNYYR